MEGNEMVFLFSLIPATTLVVIGYFVFYASTRAEGALKYTIEKKGTVRVEK